MRSSPRRSPIVEPAGSPAPAPEENSMSKPRMLFVNLPVKDLPRSVAFFRELGFQFDPRFSDDNAHCMVLDERAAFVMLLAEPFFKTFTEREIADGTRVSEALL